MKYNLVVDELALVELKESVKYYKSVSPKTSTRFKNEIVEKLELINKTPLLFQERYRGVRIAFISTFPFGVHYVVRGVEIRVIRILHTSQFYVM